MPELGTGIVTFSPFPPDPRYSECDKERLVNLFLGSHEFLLLVIESWAAEVVVRYSLDEMFDIQWALWSVKVLPEVRNIKGRWMNITTNDVAAFMKDIQIDAASLPGKAFEMIFEMPEADVGIMTFNKCCAPAQWEALGRPDILEKNCHSTCPASLIETAKMYNPNMKVDILAIPPRARPGRRLLQMEAEHADRGRSRIRSGGAHDEAGPPSPLTSELVGSTSGEVVRGCRAHARSSSSPARAVWGRPSSVGWGADARSCSPTSRREPGGRLWTRCAATGSMCTRSAWTSVAGDVATLAEAA